MSHPCDMKKGGKGNNSQSQILLELAASDLERMRHRRRRNEVSKLERFPPSCLHLVRALPGNDRCVDCGAHNPEWASISYGSLLCLSCAGLHRGLGVRTSVVRSLTMDHWSQEQILAMLEGGNDQLSEFFSRHALDQCNLSPQKHSSTKPTMSKSDEIIPLAKAELQRQVEEARGNACLIRYKTNAALFYRTNLARHASKVSDSPTPYEGRDVWRSRSRHEYCVDRNEKLISHESRQTRAPQLVPRRKIPVTTPAA